MWMSLGLLLFVLAFSVGCAVPEPPPEVTLIHATDPHLFEEPDRLGSDGKPIPPKVRELQEKQNRDAFKAFLKAAGSVGDSPRRVVLLTGDFGIDPRWSKPKNPSGPHERATQVKDLADDLKEAAVSDVYVVAGNNDLEDERATPDALEYVGQYFQDVGKALEGTRVRFGDLTACYHGKGNCTADIPGVSDLKVSLIGFPSYSFKNSSQEAANANRDVQKTQIEKFAELISAAQAKGRKVIVLSHVPELDDPFTLARQRFTESPPDKNDKPSGKTETPERPATSTWNVAPEVFRRWKELTESPTVLAVLAGHFHDSHREIYRRPYRWSSPSSLRADPSKLFLAPPLAVKLQDTSPIQARGFSVLRLRGEDLSQQLYWFDAVTAKFEGEPLRLPPRTVPKPLFVPKFLWNVGIWSADRVGWLWDLGRDLKEIDRLVVVLIAFLLAFLTIARLWKVPPTAVELTAPPPQAAGAEEKRVSDKTAAERDSETNVLTSNLGKTVVSGLAGLGVVSFLEPSWEKSGATVSAKSYYVVWFVVLFFVLLVGFAILRGVVEAWRSRIASDYRAPQWESRLPRSRGSKWDCLEWARYGWQSLWFRLRYVWSWLFSFRPTVLVFWDASLSIIFGDNVLRNAVLSDTVARMQLVMLLAVDRVREAIATSVDEALADHEAKAEASERTARVNISILSPDGLSVSYISSTRGSLARTFDRHSVAWVAISIGEARWWRKTYDAEKIVILDNHGRRIPERDGELKLNEFFQARVSSDYEAFIVIPVPRRAADGDYWKGGIHISFSRDKDFEKLWSKLEQPDSSNERFTKFYERHGEVLDYHVLTNHALRAVLSQSVDVLAELFRRFNPLVHETYVRPRLR